MVNLNNLITTVTNNPLAILVLFFVESVLIYVGINIMRYIYDIDLKSQKRKIGFCIIFTLLYILTRYSMSYIWYKIFLFINGLICSKLILKAKVSHELYIIIKVQVMLVFIETMLGDSIANIFGKQLYVEALNIVEVEIIIKLLTLILLLGTNYFYKKHEIKIKEERSSKKFEKGNIFHALSLLVILIQIFEINFYFNKVPNYILRADACFIMIYYIIIGNNLELFEKIKKAKSDVKLLTKYNSNLKEANDDIRAFRHDFNNIMQAIGGYIKLNDFEGVKRYYKDLLIEYQYMKPLTTINPNVINDANLYSIITRKSEIAKEKDIVFECISLMDFSTYEKAGINISEIMEPLLENAIKSAETSEKREIFVNCIYDKARNKNVILIISSCDNFEIETESALNKSVKSKIMKNKRLQLYTNVNDNILFQELDMIFEEAVVI